MSIQLNEEQSNVFRRLQSLVKETNQELEKTSVKLNAKSREARKAKIVNMQLEQISKQEAPKTPKVYQSFGKAFLISDVKSITKTLKKEEADATEDVIRLNKKTDFLKKELAKNQENLQAFYKRIGLTS